MTALREKVHNNIDLIPDENMQQINDIIITFVKKDDENNNIKRKERKRLDVESFCVPTERGERVDEYMREIRSNDRF